MAGEFGNPEVIEEELDILLIGGGMACCGAGYEIMRWAEAAKVEAGVDLKIKLVDKAAMDRSGAVAQGLSAINTYIGSELELFAAATVCECRCQLEAVQQASGMTRDVEAADVGVEFQSSRQRLGHLPETERGRMAERHDRRVCCTT